jgi:putative flippase GtrA
MAWRRIAKFVIVGGVGFVVDAAVLTFALQRLTSSVYAARALSFTVAVIATWLLNRTFVFASGDARTIAAEYGRYLSTQVAAALANLLVFIGLVEAIPALISMPVVPLAVGAVLGAIVNYMGSAHWVFAPKRRPGR